MEAKSMLCKAVCWRKRRVLLLGTAAELDGISQHRSSAAAEAQGMRCTFRQQCRVWMDSYQNTAPHLTPPSCLDVRQDESNCIGHMWLKTWSWQMERYCFSVKRRHTADHRALSAPAERHPVLEGSLEVWRLATTMSFASGQPSDQVPQR